MRINEEPHLSFFKNKIGFVYFLFLIVSLLSFIKAINIYESIINFSKLFTIFSAAYNISIILRSDPRYLKHLAAAMSLLLIVDSVTVYNNIVTSILAGTGPTMGAIKSVYSNKNILSAAIFVKIPFALWLLTFEKRWLRSIGIISIFFALLSTLFLSTRTFYLGSIFLTIVYVTFIVIQYYRKNQKRKILLIFVGVVFTLLVVFLLFTGTRKLYQAKNPVYADYYVDFVTRLKTISHGEKGRTSGWERSFKMIKENPLLGVGTGNWKVEELKYETPTSGAYIYLYKNHNDFIEVAADTGIFGGLLFLAIFVLIGFNFLQAFFKKGANEDTYKYLFFPAVGLFCYSFDAFFNFPADRPEICSLFAIYVGAGIAFSPQSQFVTRHGLRVTNLLTPVTRHASRVMFIATFFFMLVGSSYIFYLNFESLKLQRIAKEELNAGTLTSSSELFLNGFPAIPDINIEGEPISVTKARYLIVEEKYQQAIDLLKKDRSSPYDTRQEFFIAMAYLKMNQFDSALIYTQKVYSLKPYFSGNISLMSSTYEAKGNLPLALKVLDDHIELNNKNKQQVSEIIYKQQASLTIRNKIQKNLGPFENGVALFNRKDYNNAIKYFSEFIDREQGVAQAYEYRAFCYFYLNKFQASFDDIDRAITLDQSKSGYINLRGVNLQMLGITASACSDFQKAIEMGDKDAVNNYEKFCKKK